VESNDRWPRRRFPNFHWDSSLIQCLLDEPAFFRPSYSVVQKTYKPPPYCEPRMPSMADSPETLPQWSSSKRHFRLVSEPLPHKPARQRLRMSCSPVPNGGGKKGGSKDRFRIHRTLHRGGCLRKTWHTPETLHPTPRCTTIFLPSLLSLLFSPAAEPDRAGAGKGGEGSVPTSSTKPAASPSRLVG